MFFVPSVAAEQEAEQFGHLSDIPTLNSSVESPNKPEQVADGRVSQEDTLSFTEKITHTLKLRCSCCV